MGTIAVSGNFDSFDAIQPFGDFSRVMDESVYHAVPGNWLIGISDVVNSTAAIAAGGYKAVNLAGAATICAVANALKQTQFPFAFGGDGAHFAVSPDSVEIVRDAMAETSAWCKRMLGLDLRVALVPLADILDAGRQIRVARYASSPTVSYTMFSGGGVEWAESNVKAGRYAIDPSGAAGTPDLSGLSCQWGAVQSHNGTILSIIVNPSVGVDHRTFADTIGRLFLVLAKENRLNPIPQDGPDVRWPGKGMWLQAAVGSSRARWQFLSNAGAFCSSAFLWLLFKSQIPIGAFIPRKYRREIVANTDFQKYDDGLRMTVDCSDMRAEEIESMLQGAHQDGVVDYGLHRQDTALLTCIATGLTSGKHIHFLDGAGGGYAQAAIDMKKRRDATQDCFPNGLPS